MPTVNRVSLVSALAGLALLIGAPVAWSLAQPEGTVGDLDAVTRSAPADPALPPELDLEDAVPGLVPDLTAVEVEEPAAPPVADPTRIRLPSIGVEAPIVNVGLEDDGGMEIPHDVSTTGWYELGVAPGAVSGTAVISGHVDSREQGRGAFWDLRRMDVDDIVTVDHADGTTSEWRVVARTSFPKDELPIADIFTRFGEPRLVLITCDGYFDRDARSYSDNVVVYTVPVDA
jgi:hypothetical protein